MMYVRPRKGEETRRQTGLVIRTWAKMMNVKYKEKNYFQKYFKEVKNAD
jgi:hypothetical protein